MDHNESTTGAPVDAGDAGVGAGPTGDAGRGGGPRARGRPYTREVSWPLVALVGGAAAAGALLGAGIAILTAPHSGTHTRLALSREWRRRRPWHRSPWDRLGDELATAARRRNRRLRREDARDPVH